MSMMTNNNSNTNHTSYSDLPKQFLNYINYELSFFEKIVDRKFLINILRNDRFELKVSKSKEDNNNNDKSKYQLIYRTNNLYRFIKNLLMIREYLIKNFSKKITTT
jgi:hypothetical protein